MFAKKSDSMKSKYRAFAHVNINLEFRFKGGILLKKMWLIYDWFEREKYQELIPFEMSNNCINLIQKRAVYIHEVKL